MCENFKSTLTPSSDQTVQLLVYFYITKVRRLSDWSKKAAFSWLLFLTNHKPLNADIYAITACTSLILH